MGLVTIWSGESPVFLFKLFRQVFIRLKVLVIRSVL